MKFPKNVLCVLSLLFAVCLSAPPAKAEIVLQIDFQNVPTSHDAHQAVLDLVDAYVAMNDAQLALAEMCNETLTLMGWLQEHGPNHYNWSWIQSFLAMCGSEYDSIIEDYYFPQRDFYEPEISLLLAGLADEVAEEDWDTVVTVAGGIVTLFNQYTDVINVTTGLMEEVRDWLQAEKDNLIINL